MPMPDLKPQWRSILENRSVKDKIGVAIDSDLIDVDSADTIKELIYEGIMVWIDRTVLHHLVVLNTPDHTVRRLGVNTDVFQLTLKGIQLCDQHGIRRQ